MRQHARPRLVNEVHQPRHFAIEFHNPDCDCPHCEAMAAKSPAHAAPQLTFVQIGNLVWLGLAIGSAIAFAIDPHGAARALLAIVGR